MSNKLFTLETLNNMNIKQFTHFKNNPSKPVPLFYHDGTYNDDNWNSGEAIPIRELMSIIQYDRFPTKNYDFEVYYREADINVYGRLFTTYSHVDDYDFLQILVDGEIYHEDEDKVDYFIDQYLIKIYKQKGGIKSFIKNGKPITRNEYLSLLHILQSVGLIKIKEE